MKLPEIKLLVVILGLVVLIFVIAFNHEATVNLIHILQAFPPIVYLPMLSGKNATIVEPPAPHEK